MMVTSSRPVNETASPPRGGAFLLRWKPRDWVLTQSRLTLPPQASTFP